MGGVALTRRFHFSASHRLFNPALSEADNERLFGQCFRQHGHNYAMDVTVTGPVDAASGMVVNFDRLKEIVGREVLRDFDHRDLGADVPEFKGKLQTVENLIQIIWRRLASALPSGVRLSRLRISETENSWAELEG